MKKSYKYIAGFLIGLINSLIGACGGIIAVTALKKDGLNQKEAHANAIAIILPLSVISTAFYLIKGYAQFNDSFIYIPGGIIGAVAGGVFLKKMPQNTLRKAFALFMIWAGVRMFLR